MHSEGNGLCSAATVQLQLPFYGSPNRFAFEKRGLHLYGFAYTFHLGSNQRKHVQRSARFVGTVETERESGEWLFSSRGAATAACVSEAVTRSATGARARGAARDSVAAAADRAATA